MSSITVFRFNTLFFVVYLVRVEFFLLNTFGKTGSFVCVYIVFNCVYFLSYIFVCNIITHVYPATFIFISMSCFPFRILYYILLPFFCHANKITHQHDFTIYFEANDFFDCSPFFPVKFIKDR